MADDGTIEATFTAVLRLLPTADLTPEEAGQLHERVATALDDLIAAVRAERDYTGSMPSTGSTSSFPPLKR